MEFEQAEEEKRARSLSSTQKKGEKLDKKQVQLQMKQKQRATKLAIVGSKEGEAGKG